jgi:hypothetical protein
MNDLSQKRELHDAAKDLLDDKAFTEAILKMRKDRFSELMSETTRDKVRKLDLIAELRAIETIPQELAAIVADFKMAKRNA